MGIGLLWSDLFLMTALFLETFQLFGLSSAAFVPFGSYRAETGCWASLGRGGAWRDPAVKAARALEQM